MNLFRRAGGGLACVEDKEEAEEGADDVELLQGGQVLLLGELRPDDDARGLAVGESAIECWYSSERAQ